METKFKDNEVQIIGTLVEIKNFNQDSYTAKDNTLHDYISTTIVVKCETVENGEPVENLLQLSAMVEKLKKDQTPNTNYERLLKLESLVGTRIVIPARFKSNRFWSQNNNQLVNGTKLEFTYYRPATSRETDDKATFEFAGFVLKEFVAKENKEGNLLGYQIELAQANYNRTNMQTVIFTLPKDNKYIDALQKVYTQFSTVKIYGNCRNVVTTETVAEEPAFGEPIVKTYTHSDRKFIITSASQPLTDEHEYKEQDIRMLVEAYKAEAAKISAESNDEVSGTKQANGVTPAPQSKKSLLEGLL